MGEGTRHNGKEGESDLLRSKGGETSWGAPHETKADTLKRDIGTPAGAGASTGGVGLGNR